MPHPMRRQRTASRVVSALLCLAGVSLGPVASAGLPDPLGLEQALGSAPTHPRVQLGAEVLPRFPRRQPLFLDCHGLAFSSARGLDPEQAQAGGPLLSPLAAQQLEILERFFDVILADLSFSRYSEAMAVAYIQFDRANVRRELGQYSPLQVAELETTYQELRQRRAASEAAQRLTRALLAQALGQPGDLPRELHPPTLAPPPRDLPELEGVVAAAVAGNRWLASLQQGRGEADRRLIDGELRLQAVELILRLQALGAVETYARSEGLWRDLNLEESRVLYEREFRADLGFSMSQQTKARMQEQQVAYCQALAWAELNALQGKPLSPSAGD
jgi:hypothetical protein